MDIIIKIVKDVIRGDEIRKFNDIRNLSSHGHYWLFLGNKPRDIETGDRAYVFYKRIISGYIFYERYEEKESYEGDETKLAFKLKGPFVPIKPVRRELIGSWRWRYVETESGLRQLLGEAEMR